MTERQWLECADSPAMLALLERNVTTIVDALPTQAEQEASREFLAAMITRKLRLFACACCRHIWNALTDKRSRGAIEILEQFIDGRASAQDFHASAIEAIDARNEVAMLNWSDRATTHINRIAANAVWAACSFEAVEAARESADVAVWVGTSSDLSNASAYQSDLLRDIFGNPFRPVTLDPRWLSSTVVDLARTIYDERVWERMPILADALMDAGCDSEEIIQHCQGPGPHVRGCWVVDLLLAKE